MDETVPQHQKKSDADDIMKWKADEEEETEKDEEEDETEKDEEHEDKPWFDEITTMPEVDLGEYELKGYRNEETWQRQCFTLFFSPLEEPGKEHERTEWAQHFSEEWDPSLGFGGQNLSHGL